ncbi:hypothetical protein GX586_00600 [bacterium]|nr:hypothetical protein [bacterium]
MEWNRIVRIPAILLACAAFASAATNGTPAAARPSPDPLRFEPAIRAFEECDISNPPPARPIVFIGSSTIRGWKSLESDFAAYGALNRGFGGSHASDALHYADRAVVRYRPRQVFYYEGDNDIASGKSAERVLADFTSFAARVHATLTNTPVVFISVKPSPSRWHKAGEMQRANALVRQFAADDPLIGYVDVWDAMLGADGMPRAELFVADRLHMNQQGYALWRDIIRAHLMPPEGAPAGTNAAWRGFDIYYLRHAETMGNAARRYENVKPADRPANWNSYDAFSELGAQQVSGIVATLEGYRFDAIAVSPTWRTMQTVLPYLKARNMTAEIWPELTEFGNPSVIKPEGTVRKDLLRGAPLTIAADMTNRFRFRGPGVTNLTRGARCDAEAEALIDACETLLTGRFSNSGASVLLVGHSVSGAALIRHMTHMDPRENFWLRNARVSHLREQPDGSFELIAANGEPFVRRRPPVRVVPLR